MEKVGYFEELPGVKSSTRVNSFILLLFMMFFDVLLALTPGFILGYNFVLFNLVLLIGIFAPKYLQKILESKIFTREELIGKGYPQTKESEQLPSARKYDVDPDINTPA